MNIKNKRKLIITSVISVIFLISGLSLLWRVNQEEQVSPTDSSANWCGTADSPSGACFKHPVYIPHNDCIWYEPFHQFIHIDAVRYQYWKDGYCPDGSALNGKMEVYGLRWLHEEKNNEIVDWQCPAPSDSKPFRWFFYRYTTADNCCTLSAQQFDAPEAFKCDQIKSSFKGGKVNDKYVWLAARKGNVIGMPVTAVPKSGCKFEKWSDGDKNPTRKDLHITTSRDIKAICSKIPDPVCGDGSCNGNENASTCPKDCPARCGDGRCTHTENASTCPKDCPARCGDDRCTHTENASTCPKDCPARCGDGRCTHTENASTCPKDCPANCGDGNCTHTENANICPKDCPANCGDHFCTDPENAAICPGDCKELCGDNFCTHNENAAICPIDCPGKCGDGKCTHDEDVTNCPKDCPANCGDNVCTHEESELTCPADCQKEIVITEQTVPQTGFFDSSRNMIILGLIITLIGMTFSKISLYLNRFLYLRRKTKAKNFERRVLKE